MLGLFRGTHLFVIFVAVLISVSVLTTSAKPAYAYPSNQDTWGLSANQTYVDTTIRISDCSPYGGDTDNDGICDHWEDGTFGQGLHIHFSQNGVNYSYDLNCDNTLIQNDCPSPQHKDVYVELDWMQGHAPSQTAIADVVNAFNIAPVPNDDGTTGVHLHVQYGEDPSTSSGDTGVHVTLLKVKTAVWNTNDPPNYGYWVLKQNRFGTIAERNTSANSPDSFCTHADGTFETWHDCGTAKRQVFHYSVFIHQQYEVPNSSGWAEIFGNDFVISLGSWYAGGSVDDQESAFMHELGHNLGLFHGGGAPPDVNGNGYDQLDDDSDNCKPNYLSVMSYEYQFRSTGTVVGDYCRPLDYSRTALNTLNETPNNLRDSNVGSYPYPNPDPDPAGTTQGTCNNSNINGKERPIWYMTTQGLKTSTTGKMVDWNGNGINNFGYSQNLNNPAGLIQGCVTSTKSSLVGHDDWNNGLSYTFTSSALSASGTSLPGGGSTTVLHPGSLGHFGTCDGLPINPIGYVDLSKVNLSSAELKKRLAEFGVLYTKLPSTTSGDNGNYEIVAPSVLSMNDVMSKATHSLGTTFAPAVETVRAISSLNNIPVYSFASESQGNLDESACNAHTEMTLDTMINLRANMIGSIKFAVDAIPNASFRNPDSDIHTIDGLLDGANQLNSQNDIPGVIAKLRSVQSDANDNIIDKDAQQIISPRINDALTTYMIAGGITTPHIHLDSTPADPSGSNVLFTFHSDVAGSTFECQLDGGTFSTCASPQSYSDLSAGQHSFKVRATASGLTDTASEFTWQVEREYVNYVLIGYLAAISFGIAIALVAYYSRNR